MDAMSLLRSCRDDTPLPDAQHLRGARDRLEQRFDAAGRVRRTAPRRLVLIGGAAAAAATALVVASVTAGPAPQASAEASRVLEAASGAARAQDAPAVRVVAIRSEGLSLQLDPDGSGAVVAAYNTRSMETLRVPRGDGQWVRTSWSLAPDVFYGGAAARALAEQEGAGDPAHSAADPLVERSGTGRFTNGELGGGSLFGDDPAELRGLPTDPERLLAALRRADVGVDDGGQAAHVLQAASVVLSSGVADGDEQAAVFQALRLQRGLTVTDESVDVDGRTGVAVGEASPQGDWDTRQLLLDPRTGEYLGDRSVALHRQGVVPAGAVVSSTTVLQH